MKNLFKLIIALFCCTAAVSLTSCLSDDESSTIDAATQKSYQQRMAGSYYGKARFYKSPANATSSYVLTQKYDSTGVSWMVYSDSTITLSGLQASALDSAIIVSDSNTKYESLFNALHDCVTVPTVSISYAIPYSSYVTTSYIRYYVNMSVEVKLNYDNADHYVYFDFGTPSGNPGYWDTQRQMEYYFVLSGIYISDTRITNYSQLSKAVSLSSDYMRQIGVIVSTN